MELHEGTWNSLFATNSCIDLIEEESEVFMAEEQGSSEMLDPKRLPYLLRLLDDESPPVRQAVLQQLQSYGSALEKELAQLAEPPTQKQLMQLKELLEPGAFELLESWPSFRPGDFVQESKSGFQGLVVEVDSECQASQEWFWSQQSQPKREQPWYYILIHGTPHVAYTAQSQLLPDSSLESIRHPLLPLFFNELEVGTYQRNSRPWSGL